jgi:ornithine--oxo-acid transaminase
MIANKALSGGFYPVAAVISSAEILGVFEPGSHGSTFGGNPLACAVARAALRVIEDDGLVENSRRLGAWLLNELRTIVHPAIQEVRGVGLLIGIDLAVPARPICERMMASGILCKETHENVIRLAPPLVISHEDLAWAVAQIRDVFSRA